MDEKNQNIETQDSNKYTNIESQNKPIKISLIRITICVIIWLGIVFLKFNSPENFENFKEWYKKSICEEKYSAVEIKENTFKFISEKFQNATRKFSDLI